MHNHDRKKGVTQLFVVVVSGIVLFLLYVIWSFLLPIVGTIDNAMYNWVSGSGLSAPWISTFTDRGVWILHDAFYWYFFGVAAAIILVMIIYAVRRGPDERYYQA